MIKTTIVLCAAVLVILAVGDADLPFVGSMGVFVAVLAFALAIDAHTRLDKLEKGP